MKIKSLSITFLTAVSLYVSQVQAQSLFPFQQLEILGNNTSLHAAAETTAVDMADNLAGLTLANPEVGFSYMWGAPTDVPNKINIDVSQTFDFPTLSGARKQVAKANNRSLEIGYMNARSTLALEIENAIIEYIYQKQTVNHLSANVVKRTELQTIAEQALKSGVITYIDYNAYVLAAIAAEDELTQAQIALNTAMQDLKRLNNGTSPSILPETWPQTLLPSSFGEWLDVAVAVAPELQQLKAQIDIADKEVNLRKKEALPEFGIGYVNELVKNSNYHGVSLSLSLPLWGNSSRIKAAKAARTAAMLNAETASVQFALTKENEYNKAQMLMNAAHKYERAYAEAIANTEKYLDMAYDKRTMSILEYKSAQADLYTYALKTLQAQRDFQLARAALYAPTL